VLLRLAYLSAMNVFALLLWMLTPLASRVNYTSGQPYRDSASEPCTAWSAAHSTWLKSGW
jgi:hypothetical protein